MSEIARAALASGASDLNLVEMASAGSFGTDEGNTHRDLKRRILGAAGFITPTPTTIQVPLLNIRGDSAKVEMREIDILLPHDYLASMCQHALFSDDLFGNSRLKKFWAKQSMSDPKWVSNPLAAQPKDSVIPFLVHGDGAEFQDNESINVLSFRSLLSNGPTSSRQFLLVAIPKRVVCTQKVHGRDTMHEVWKWLVWSFNALFEGKHPVKLPDGSQIQDPQRAAVAGKALDPKRKLRGVRA